MSEITEIQKCFECAFEDLENTKCNYCDLIYCVDCSYTVSKKYIEGQESDNLLSSNMSGDIMCHSCLEKYKDGSKKIHYDKLVDTRLFKYPLKGIIVPAMPDNELEEIVL